jgi:dimethylhistidine N-methyltransferase
MKILLRDADSMVAPFTRDGILVELGCGSLYKTEVLLQAFLKRRQTFRFIPIDISRRMLKKSASKLHEDYGSIDVTACCGEYLDSLNYLKQCDERKLVVWLGSSIGNFDKHEVLAFLARLKRVLRPADGLLIGFDLKKNPQTVERAYNDAQGITAAYHLNVLHRLNREYGADFKVDDFFHRSIYDSDEGAVKAYIISRKNQQVGVKGLDLNLFFRKDEWVFNEMSCKYDPDEIADMAHGARLIIDGQWFDENRDFALVRFRPRG